MNTVDTLYKILRHWYKYTCFNTVRSTRR